MKLRLKLDRKLEMDTKALQDAITCPICFEVFNEVYRCPRMLSCGHTFCHYCLLKILEQTPSCPTCKTGIEHQKVKLIPVNFSVKGMIPSTKQVKAIESLQIKGSCSTHEKFQSEGFCSKHSYFNELRCMACKLWICAMCCSLNHKHCRTLLVQDAYNEMKENVVQTVDKDIDTMAEISIHIPLILDSLDEDKNELLEEIKKAEVALKQCKKRKDCLISLLSEESEYYTNLLSLREKVANSSNSNDYSTAVSELSALKVHGNGLIFQMRLQNMKYMIGKRGPVYVVDDSNEMLYGQIELNHGQVWIYSFKSEKPSGLHVPLKDILSTFGVTSDVPRKQFLKLSPEDEYDSDSKTVDIVIETDGESPRAKNFALLCSGLLEQTYKGKTIDHYNNPSRFLLDSGPLPVVEGIRNSDPKVPWVEGVVSGMSECNSYFNIALEDISNYSKYKIGMVVSGLRELKDFNGRNLIITESGFVI